MTIQRYRHKPRLPHEDVLSTAQYLPGESITDLRAVAYLADPGAELAVVPLPSGVLLLVRWLSEDGEAVEHTIVRAGHYLAHGSVGGLFETDEADLRRWYNEVEIP